MKGKCPAITKIILFGVTNKQLNLSKIENNNITVGILQQYTGCQCQFCKTESIIDYEMWAFPDGIKIYSNQLTIINDNTPEFSFNKDITQIQGWVQCDEQKYRPPNYYYNFILTNDSLKRTYYSCLVWNEKKFVINDAHIQQISNSKKLPKCTINQLITDPLMLDPTTTLVYIPKCIILYSQEPLFNFQKQILFCYYRNVICLKNSVYLSTIRLQRFKQLANQFGYPQAERIFDQQVIKEQKQKNQNKKNDLNLINFQQQNNKINIKQNQYNYCINRINLKHFYTFLLFLPNYNSQQQYNTLTDLDKSIINIPRLSSEIFGLPDWNFLGIIQLLGFFNLCLLWRCLLLQKQILIFSSNVSFMVQVCETLLLLLKPFVWENIYIPFLPFHLHMHIDALGGYLIGMSKIHMNYMIQHFNMQNKVLFDLDQLIIVQQGSKNQSQMPKSIAVMLQNQLKNIGLYRSKPSIFQMGTEEIKKSKIQRTLQIQRIFFTTLLILINNYIPYVQNNSQGIQINKLQYSSIFKDKSWKQFINSICKTMIFIRLCESHLKIIDQIKTQNKTAVNLFAQCHLLLKKEDTTFWQLQKGQKRRKIDEYLKKIVHNSEYKCINKTQNLNAENYFVKYLSYLKWMYPKEIMKKQLKNKQKQGWFQWLFNLINPKISQSMNKSIENEKVKRLNKKNSFNLEIINFIKLEQLFPINKNIYKLKIIQN